jgi:tagatose-1,6-bisphosphate aldolase
MTVAPTSQRPRGLASIATPDGTLAIIAMDQRNTLKQMYAAVGIDDADAEELTAIKADTIEALRGSASAFLLDPDYGVPALQRLSPGGPRAGVLVAAEPAVRGTVDGEPRTHRDPRLDARWVADQGGDAVKFLVQLRADRIALAGRPDTAAEVLQVIREVVADCREVGVPSVIENLVFPLVGERPPSPAERADRIIEAAQLIDELQPDLIKLEYPGDAAACRRLAASISTPWAVLSAGVAFDSFADAVRVSCDDGGASGFIAGRSVWKDSVGMSRAGRQDFLGGEARRRLDALVQMIDGRATPLSLGGTT